MDSAPLDRVAVSLQLISSLFSPFVSDHIAFSQRALHDSIVNGSGLIDENALAAFLQSAFPSTGFHLQYPPNKLHASALRISSDAKFSDQEKGMLDDSIRSLLINTASSAVSQGTPLMLYPGPPHSSHLPRLLDLIQHSAKLSTSPGSNVRVSDFASYCRSLEELLEIGTVEDCVDVFSRLELNLDLLASEVPKSNASSLTPAAPVSLPQSLLATLRACNGLLRRLSKATDVQLCGRVLIFIARLFPLSDKSGSNLGMEINSSLPLFIEPVDPQCVLESLGEPSDGKQVKGKLYLTFWGLQASFKNPQSLQQPGHWTKFKEDLASVLSALEDLPVSVPASAPNDMSMLGEGGWLGSVKYLTAPRLLGLQLRDATFRRQFLLQVLTALHGIKHPSKNAPPPTGAAATAAAAKAQEGVDELTSRVFGLLSKTEHGGAMFAAAVKTVLDRETNWLSWKKEKCPPIENAVDTSYLDALAKRKEKRFLEGEDAISVLSLMMKGGAGGGEKAPAPVVKRRRTGSTNVPKPSFADMIAMPMDQMAGLSAEERKTMPSFEEMMRPVVEDMDPDSCIEPEYRRKNQDPIYAWKASRMLCKTQLSVFSDVEKNDLEEAMCLIEPELGARVKEAKAEREERIKALLEEERLQAEQDKEAKVQDEPAQIATAAASFVPNDDLEGDSSCIAKDAEDPMLVEENEDGEVRQGDQDDE